MLYCIYRSKHQRNREDHELSGPSSGNERAMEYAKDKNPSCYRSIRYSTFDAEEKIGGKRDCDQNWRGAENNTTAYTKNPPKSSEDLIKKTCYRTARQNYH